MKPTFLLFHAENVNEDQNSVCHLILIPVVDGQQQPPQEFFFNPEAPFDFVMSGLTADQVESFAPYSVQWPRVQAIFDKYDMTVCTAEGYSAHALYGTLTRLGIAFSPIRYCNAKAICRRSMDEVSYSLDFLSYRFYNDTISSDSPVDVASRWCELALRGLEPLQDCSLDEFLDRVKISKGVVSADGFIPSLCKRDYSNRVKHSFDPSSVAVEADPEHPFYGMNVVFTGKMESMTRNDARAAIVKVGGSAPERLTQETDYLVVGVQDLRVVGEKGLSGKMKTAAKYKEKGFPIEIIDEKDFIEMLGEVALSASKPLTPPLATKTTPFLSKEDIATLSDEDVRKGLDAIAAFRKKMGFDD